MKNQVLEISTHDGSISVNCLLKQQHINIKFPVEDGFLILLLKEITGIGFISALASKPLGKFSKIVRDKQKEFDTLKEAFYGYYPFKRPVTTEQFLNVVENEGIDYTVTSFYGAETVFEDSEIHKTFHQARIAITSLESLIDSKRNSVLESKSPAN